jgi:hypothetical protein
MPHSPLHKKKLKTNVAIFLGIMGFCALIMVITIIKLKAGAAL